MSRLEHLTQVSAVSVDRIPYLPVKKVILTEKRNLFPNVEYNNEKWQPCSHYVDFNNIMDASTPINGHLKYHYLKIIVRLKTCVGERVCYKVQFLQIIVQLLCRLEMPPCSK